MRTVAITLVLAATLVMSFPVMACSSAPICEVAVITSCNQYQGFSKGKEFFVNVQDKQACELLLRKYDVTNATTEAKHYLTCRCYAEHKIWERNEQVD